MGECYRIDIDTTDIFDIKGFDKGFSLRCIGLNSIKDIVIIHADVSRTIIIQSFSYFRLRLLLGQLDCHYITTLKKIMKIGILQIVFFTLLSHLAFSQITFTNSNDRLSEIDFHSGVAIGIADMNGDNKDDIIRMNQGYDLYIEYQNGPNDQFTSKYIGEMGGSSRWSMCIADVDNNGYNEILASGSYDNIRLNMSNATGTDYSVSMLPSGSSIFVQGSNFADIDNDGFVDIFACHDDGESKIWSNDGTGNFTVRDEWIDMSIDGDSGENASGNYGSIWADVDSDGDVDMYIAKCRLGTTSLTDTRRLNTLWINDGNGNFTEEGESRGLRIGYQSWTSDFQDVNNDGHLDCFLTNHDFDSQLFINDGNGYFTEAQNTGLDNISFPIQGVMRDFDNDGWVDVLTAGNKGQLFINNGDLTFTEVDGLFDSNEMESYALGDLNGDGFVDVYGGYANIYTNPSNVDDVLWINQGNSNNHLSVTLNGVESNRNALGARIAIYGEWGQQIREVRSGESYGISNAHKQFFGLGSASSVDSMVISWPSGLIQTEYEMPINASLIIEEGSCLAQSPELSQSGTITLCDGETLSISAPDGYSSYVWSNGSTDQSIEITEGGVYSLKVSDENGCIGFSQGVNVLINPQLTPTISTDGGLNICDGESLVLSTENQLGAISYEWSNGENGLTTTVTQAGIYTVDVAGECDTYTSNEIEVIVSETPDAPTADPVQAILVGTSGIITAMGDNLAWYDSETASVPLAEGPEFMTPIITEDTYFYVEDRAGVAGDEERVGMLDHSGTPYSSIPGISRSITFDAFEEFILDSVTVYTDMAAERRIIVFDQAGSELTSAMVDISEGRNQVFVGMRIPAGENLRIGTDESVNNENLGAGDPRLQRSSQDVDYPYVVDDVVSLNDSPFGPQYYYYFYDWKITTADDYCISERIEILVDALIVSTTDIEGADAIQLYPNPTEGQVFIDLELDMSIPINMIVADITGRQVYNQAGLQSTNRIDLSELSQGMYTLQLTHDGNTYVGKIIIQ